MSADIRTDNRVLWLAGITWNQPRRSRAHGTFRKNISRKGSGHLQTQPTH